ncbi:hypothetical protein GALMADRAFT_147613 [Galerina marginata CBS 339.88]|uniref:Uncharacterized protein n=1 Tax=Galerina marginata (strain CBS 339.88) TaxID=685588 RepID=A0A067S793_GALM3|nr:hypothetical protein GALMADRAFT_147613 [Galerina marginata CBS 339.88]
MTGIEDQSSVSEIDRLHVPSQLNSLKPAFPPAHFHMEPNNMNTAAVNSLRSNVTAHSTISMHDLPDNPRKSKAKNPVCTMTATEHKQSFSKHAKNWTEGIQKTIGDAKGIVDSVNALTTVAAFIGGVQSQIISSTLDDNKTPLEIAINFFAFLGLVLDVVGTFLGVLTIILLRSVIKYQLTLVESATKVQLVLEELDKPSDTEKIGKMTAKIKEFFDGNPSFRRSVPRDYRDKINDLPLAPNNSPRFISRILTGVLSILSSLILFNMGIIPLLTMGLGIICLLASTTLLAAQKLPVGIWATCVSIVGLSLSASLSAIGLLGVWLILNMGHTIFGRGAGEGGELDSREGCQDINPGDDIGKVVSPAQGGLELTFASAQNQGTSGDLADGEFEAPG